MRKSSLFQSPCILWFVLFWALLPTSGARAADAPPPVLGVNIAGSYHMFHSDKLCYEQEAWYRALQDLGVQFVDVNVLIEHLFQPQNLRADYLTTPTVASVAARIKRIDDQMTSYGLRYTLSVELANWMPGLELTRGGNEFAHADGSHRWDLRPEWLDGLLAPKRAKPALIGINCDEGMHNQLNGNKFMWVVPNFDKPYYAVTSGLTMDSAWMKLALRCWSLRATHYQGRVAMLDETVWPDMYHISARAGWVICPKLLKESLSSVTMAGALGAARQYTSSGTDLWICNDLWKLQYYPGWSPAALRSALLMGYWLGASTIFVENLDYSDANPALRHPLASPQGSLLHWIDPDHYEMTHHGQVVRDFFKNYVPSHPRPFSWRDYRPRVAIIRLTDGDCGQPSPVFSNRLLGNPQHPSDAISAEWLHVWPLLTHGYAHDGAISLFNFNAYSDFQNKPFFVPIDSVAVFDHTVRGSVLDGVRCFIVCGHALSQETFLDIAQRVEQGATCIIARRLYNLYSAGARPGNWLVVDSFTDPAIAGKLAPFLGPPDVARFRFKTHTVEFRPEADLDTLTVKVINNSTAAAREWLLAE